MFTRRARHTVRRKWHQSTVEVAALLDDAPLAAVHLERVGAAGPRPARTYHRDPFVRPRVAAQHRRAFHEDGAHAVPGRCNGRADTGRAAAGDKDVGLDGLVDQPGAPGRPVPCDA